MDFDAIAKTADKEKLAPKKTVISKCSDLEEVKDEKLAEKKDSDSSSKVRERLSSGSEKKSSSDSEAEETVSDVKKEKKINPLFALKKLMEERNAKNTESENDNADTVKKDEDGKQDVKEILKTDVDNKDEEDDVKGEKEKPKSEQDIEKEKSEKKSEESKAKVKIDESSDDEDAKRTTDKRSEEESKEKAIKRQQGPIIDLKYLGYSSDLREFKDILVFELGPNNAILVQKQISIPDLERRVHDLIADLERKRVRYSIPSKKESTVKNPSPISLNATEKKCLAKFNVNKTLR